MNTDNKEFAEGNSLLERYELALKDKSSFRNCAGFVKYMLGINNQEVFVSPNDLSEKGLLKYLKPNGQLDIDLKSTTLISKEEYLKKASESDVAALLVNNVPNEQSLDLRDKVNATRSGWMYIHFGVVDSENPEMVYMRPDIEKSPKYAPYEDFVECVKEFEGMESMVVFFNTKENYDE